MADSVNRELTVGVFKLLFVQRTTRIETPHPKPCGSSIIIPKELGRHANRPQNPTHEPPSPFPAYKPPWL